MHDRGQTQQDFALGVSVLLLTIIGAFLFVQTGVFQTFDTTTPGTSAAQADRAASHLVENYSVDGTHAIIRYDERGGIDRELDDDLDDFLTQAGIDVSTRRRADPNVNVSIVSNETLVDGGTAPARHDGDLLAWGEDTAGTENVATTIRVVRLRNDEVPGSKDLCDPNCWLVVRVW